MLPPLLLTLAAVQPFAMDFPSFQTSNNLRQFHLLLIPK
jgi:hypothetical protein